MDYYEQLEHNLLRTVEVRQRVDRRCSRCHQHFVADTQWLRCCPPCRAANRRADTGRTMRVRMTNGKKETA